MPHAFRFLSAPALRLVLPALTLLAAAHCETSYADTQAEVGANSTAPKPALRKLNPAPAHAYEVRLILDNASDLASAADGKSAFSVVEGTAQFGASNAPRCAASNAVSDHVPTISSHEPFRMVRISPTEYVGIVYADMLLDEDYYGRGVCHWKLAEARVALRARQDAADTRFVAGLQAQKVFAGGTQARYFWKGYYPRFEQGKHTDFGRDKMDRVPADKRGEFLTVTLMAKRIASDVQDR